MSLSFWEQQHWLVPADLIVVGGGLTGIQAAIHAKILFPRWRILVLEAGALPSGASTKNAGFACIGSLSELMEDVATLGLDQTVSLMLRRYRGLIMLREQVGDAALNYRHTGGHELFRFGEEARLDASLEIMDAVNEAFGQASGEQAIFTQMNHTLLGFRDILGCISTRIEGQLDPGAMIKALTVQAHALGIDIHTGWKVASLLPNGSHISVELAELGSLRAEHVLVATNGFARHLVPHLPLRPVRNQVILTDDIPSLAWEGNFHYDRGYVYARNVGRRVLIGGFRHFGGPEEETEEFGLSDTIQEHLERFLKEVILPDQAFRISHRWSGILGVGDKRDPIIEEVAPQLWVAVRFGGMGVALSTLVARSAIEQMTARNPRPE